MVALVATKMTDLLTTIFGLVAVDGLVERNPVAATAVGVFGIPGLAALSLLGVSVVVFVVEWGVSWLEGNDQFDGDPTVVYLVSYVPLSLLYGFTTVQNVALILTRVS